MPFVVVRPKAAAGASRSSSASTAGRPRRRRAAAAGGDFPGREPIRRDVMVRLLGVKREQSNKWRERRWDPAVWSVASAETFLAGSRPGCIVLRVSEGTAQFAARENGLQQESCG